jgi:hypothetical protein
MVVQPGSLGEAARPAERSSSRTSDSDSRGSDVRRWLTRNDRFLTPRMLASIAIYLFLSLSYVQVTVNNDGLVYYDFMRRLLGEHVQGYAYQFGSSFWDLPFYLAGRLVSVLGVGNTVSGLGVGDISVAIAANVAVLIMFYLSWRLIKGLGLRGGPGAILLTIFGSPLFYYAIFQPGYKHVVDALLITLFAFLLLQAHEDPGSRRLAIAIGAVLGVAITVRYADAVLIVGPILLYLRARAFAQTYVLTTVAIAGATAILLIPLARGIPYRLPVVAGSTPTTSQPASSSSSAPSAEGDITQNIQISPVAPLKMLFTTKRGLFLWTPLTFFATIGYVLFCIRAGDERMYLLSLGASALSLLFVHALWGTYWTGGYSFSQRFLTGLFPVFVIGVAALLQSTRMLIAPVLVACVAWSMFISLYHWYGYDNVSERDGLRRFVQLYTTHDQNFGLFWHQRVTSRIEHRWQAYAEWLTP